MGYDLVAYLAIDQEEVDAFMRENGLSKEHDYACNDRVTGWFRQEHRIPPELSLYYEWNEPCGMHEIYSIYSISFIRDDERLHNRRYHLLLEKKIGAPYPEELWSMWIHCPKDALKVAAALRQFYGEDYALICFADWLEKTARVAHIYELSV